MFHSQGRRLNDVFMKIVIKQMLEALIFLFFCIYTSFLCFITGNYNVNLMNYIHLYDIIVGTIHIYIYTLPV